MTIKQLKQIQPLAEVVELDPNARYIVKVNKRLRMDDIHHLISELQKNGIHGILLEGADFEFYTID